MLVKWKRNIPSRALLTLSHAYLPCYNVYIWDPVIKLPKTCTQIPFRGTFVSLYQQFFFFRPLPIQAWHLQKCMLPLLRTSQNTVEPRAYRCEKSPACRIYSLVLKTECVITTDQWSCFNGCKSRNPPQDHHRASSPLKADVQIDMHDNAMSVAAATAKIGSHASSNGLPYKDGIYLLCTSECNIYLLCKVIV